MVVGSTAEAVAAVVSTVVAATAEEPVHTIAPHAAAAVTAAAIAVAPTAVPITITVRPIARIPRDVPATPTIQPRIVVTQQGTAGIAPLAGEPAIPTVLRTTAIPRRQAIAAARCHISAVAEARAQPQRRAAAQLPTRMLAPAPPPHPTSRIIHAARPERRPTRTLALAPPARPTSRITHAAPRLLFRRTALFPTSKTLTSAETPHRSARVAAAPPFQDRVSATPASPVRILAPQPA